MVLSTEDEMELIDMGQKRGGSRSFYTHLETYL